MGNRDIRARFFGESVIYEVIRGITTFVLVHMYFLLAVSCSLLIQIKPDYYNKRQTDPKFAQRYTIGIEHIAC